MYQGEWLKEYGNSGLYYSRTFDETYANGFTSDNISDTSDEVKLQSSDEVRHREIKMMKQWKAMRTLTVTQLLIYQSFNPCLTISLCVNIDIRS